MGFCVSIVSQFERISLVHGSNGTYPAGGWVVGWLVGWSVGQSEIKANSASVAVEVEVEVEAELGKNSGPLTSLPVNRLNGDRLQRRRSCQK